MPPRALLATLITLSAAASLSFSAPLQDAHLAQLLRAMATLKAAVAATVITAIFWRLRQPIAPARFAFYTAASMAMAGGPALIWGLAHVALGAALLHAGLAGALVVLWRDPVLRARLATAR